MKNDDNSFTSNRQFNAPTFFTTEVCNKNTCIAFSSVLYCYWSNKALPILTKVAPSSIAIW